MGAAYHPKYAPGLLENCLGQIEYNYTCLVFRTGDLCLHLVRRSFYFVAKAVMVSV